MKERPIIFSGPMVRAILRDENPKTQTRRIMKPQPKPDPGWLGGALWPIPKRGLDKSAGEEAGNIGVGSPPILAMCPHGKPGDRLWVRETFCIETNFNMESESSYPPPFQDGRPIRRHPGGGDWGPYWEQCHYRATDKTPELAYGDDGEYAEPTCRWRPSIHMPRWASRIILEITAVRVERLQDISEEDAKAEGIEPHYGGWKPYNTAFYEADGVTPANYFRDPRESFRSLWLSINGAGSWDANPWVWVIEFKRVVEAA